MKLKLIGIILLCCFNAFTQTYEWDKAMFFSAGDQLAIMNNDGQKEFLWVLSDKGVLEVYECKRRNKVIFSHM